MARIKKDRAGKARSGAIVSTNRVYFAFKKALNEQNGLTKEQINSVSVASYMSFDALVKHDGNETQCIDLVAAISVAIVLAERGIGIEFLGELNLALEALWRMKRRAKATGKWRFDGVGIVEMRTGLDLYTQQLAIASNHLLREALNLVRGRVTSNSIYKDIEHFEAE